MYEDGRYGVLLAPSMHKPWECDGCREQRLTNVAVSVSIGTGHGERRRDFTCQT